MYTFDQSRTRYLQYNEKNCFLQFLRMGYLFTARFVWKHWNYLRATIKLQSTEHLSQQMIENRHPDHASRIAWRFQSGIWYVSRYSMIVSDIYCCESSESDVIHFQVICDQVGHILFLVVGIRVKLMSFWSEEVLLNPPWPWAATELTSLPAAGLSHTAHQPEQ